MKVTFSSVQLLQATPPWIHVLSKFRANSSLHTQCAAVATGEVLSPTVFHCRLRHARKKRHKQDQLLREIIVPSTLVKISTTQIHFDIIVFDGGVTVHLQYDHLMESHGAPSLSVTFILKMRLGATLGLPFL
jgi:hypothetical protein